MPFYTFVLDWFASLLILTVERIEHFNFNKREVTNRHLLENVV